MTDFYATSARWIAFLLLGIALSGAGFARPLSAQTPTAFSTTRSTNPDNITHQVSLLISPNIYVSQPFTIDQSDTNMQDRYPSSVITYTKEQLSKLKSKEPLTISLIVLSAIAQALEETPHLKLLDAETLRKDIQDAYHYKNALGLIESWAKLGGTAYQHLDSKSSVNNYQEAVKVALDAGLFIVAPKQYAELLKQLALAQLDLTNDLTQPLRTIREMLYYNPKSQYEKGFYPLETIRVYEGAKYTLHRELEAGPLALTLSREALISKARLIIFATVLEIDEHPTISLHLWDAKSQRTLSTEQLTLPSLHPIDIFNVASQLAHRLKVCLTPQVEASQQPNPDTEHDPTLSSIAIGLDFITLYYLNMKGPDWMKPFPFMGVQGNFFWHINSEFAIKFSLQFVRSLTEYSGALLEPFQGVRTLLGGDLSWRWWHIRLGLSSALEFAYFGESRYCYSDAYHDISTGCVTASHNEPESMIFGVNLEPHLGGHIFDALEIRISAPIGFYVYPFKDVPMNFPISANIGAIYRF